MKNNNCSKEKIIEAYYNQSIKKDTLDHIDSCKECSKYYQELVNLGGKINVLNKIDTSSDTFAVRQIVNKHLSIREQKKILREAVLFALTGLSLLGGIYGTMIAFDYRAVLAFYLIIFINLPVLLLPAILKRKELI